jgi:hypothetical protein
VAYAPSVAGRCSDYGVAFHSDGFIRRLASWLLPALIEVAFFAQRRELPFFADAKKRNPKKVPLEAKPFVLF